MAIIWIVERDERSRAHLSEALMGDFAVRAFGSLKSASHIARLSKDVKPDCIIVSAGCYESVSWQRLAEIEAAMILIGPYNTEHASLGAIGIVSWEDTFQLVTTIKGHLSKSVLRSQQTPRLKYRDLDLDVESFELSFPVSGEVEHLSKKEAMILKLLLQKPGECLKRQEIKNRVWANLIVTERTIDSHISRLRKRLRASEARIESVYGGGYILY